MRMNLKRYIWLGLVLLCLIVCWPTLVVGDDGNKNRTNGLTVIEINSDTGQGTELCYLTMIIKTGYANDPEDKAGLTKLTNELFYYLLRDSSAFEINYNTLADFSFFNFTVTAKNYDNFCKELDYFIRKDALLMYDLCNALIQYHLNEPQPHSRVALINFQELIYGNLHPYYKRYLPNYKNLAINDANSWFRLIYRPNNIIISSSKKLPEDFLMRPFGRDITKPVEQNELMGALFNEAPEEKFAAIHDNLSTVIIGFPAPRLDSDQCIPTILIEAYLQDKLWEEIREKSGLCYDLQVYYSCFNEPAAPKLMVICQTLPEDTENVIGKIVSELRNLASNGITTTNSSKIIKRGKNSQPVEKRLSVKVMDNALQKFFNQSWIADQDLFYQKMGQVTPEQIREIMTERLDWLKISIAGPVEVKDLLKELELTGKE